MERGAGRRAAPRRPAVGSSPPIPFAGELLLWAAGALRLSVIRGGDGHTSEATAKRAATGSARVRGERIRALARSFVGALFEGPYLAACGFEPVEVELLHVQLAAVLEWFLESAGTTSRQAPTKSDQGSSSSQASTSLRKRLCGFRPCACGTHWHLDLLACAPHWRGLGVSGSLEALRLSCKRPPSDQAIYEKAKIAKNTFKHLRDGKRLPQEENVLRLAKALSHFGAQGPRRVLSEAEVRFSLRIACLVAEAHQKASWGAATAEGLSSFWQMLSFFLAALRGAPEEALNELAAHGYSARAWPLVSLRFLGACLPDLQAHWLALEQQHSATMPDLQGPRDPEKTANGWPPTRRSSRLWPSLPPGVRKFPCDVR